MDKKSSDGRRSGRSDIPEIHPTQLRRGGKNGIAPESIRIRSVSAGKGFDDSDFVFGNDDRTRMRSGTDSAKKQQTVHTAHFDFGGADKTKDGSNVTRSNAAASKMSVEAEGEQLARKRMNTILCAAFAFVVIIGGAVVAFHLLRSDKPTYSEFEQRELEKMPSLSAKTLADGSFTEDFDRYFSDNFPMRESFVKSATLFKRFRGIRAFDKNAKQIIAGDSNIYSSGDLEISVDEDKFENPDIIYIPGVNDQTEGGVDLPEQQPVIPGDDITPGAETPSDPEKVTTDTPYVEKAPGTEGASEAPDNGNDADTDNAPTENRRELDSLYLVGGTAYEYFRGSKNSSNDYINVLNTYVKYIPENVNIYDLVIPTHTEFGLKGEDRTVSNDQKPVIEHIGSSLDPRIKFVNPYDRLYSGYKNGEYLYFRTDHHWTIRGAYKAYEEFCEIAGIEPVSAESYGTGRIEPFLGSFYRSSGYEPAMKDTPDYVEYFMIDIPCTVTRYDKNNSSTKGGLYYKRVNGESNGYLAFMGGDFPYIYIKTENTNGKKLMIFKESFANPLIGLLAPHFQEIHVADIRSFKYNSINFIKQYGITDVLFCNGIMSANSSARIKDLLGLMNK